MWSRYTSTTTGITKLSVCNMFVASGSDVYHISWTWFGEYHTANLFIVNRLSNSFTYSKSTLCTNCIPAKMFILLSYWVKCNYKWENIMGKHRWEYINEILAVFKYQNQQLFTNTNKERNFYFAPFRPACMAHLSSEHHKSELLCTQLD